MASSHKWKTAVGSGLVGVAWAIACASTQSGVGGESHFVACKTDADCAAEPGDQVCFVTSSAPGTQGLCVSRGVLIDAAAHENGGAGGVSSTGGAGNSLNQEGGPAGTGTYCGAPERAIYPAPPTSFPPNTNKDIEIVAAQYTIDLGDSDPPPGQIANHFLDIGFDLDNTCTTPTNIKAGTCKLPSYGLGVLDGKGGIDNALGKLLQTVHDQIGNFSSLNYSRTLQAGKANVLLRMQHWNGEPNDDQVTVSMMVAAPFDSLSPGVVPHWDGTDAWPIASDAVLGSIDKPKFVDTHAYVTNNQVVAGLANANLRLDVGLTSVQDVKLDLKLTAAFVVCTIAPVPADAGKWGYTLDKCTLGGRWSANDLVQQLGRFPDPLNNNKPLCAGTNEYQKFKLGVCQQVDVTADPTAAPTTPCDALSMAFTYNMKPALLGDLWPLAPIKDPCPSYPFLNPKYDCCESITAPDSGVDSNPAACGIPFDAGPPPSGTGGGPSGGPTDASTQG